MAESIWSQDIFSKGELSPLMYARITVNAYYNGLKTATNCISYPQGGIGKRFGTLYNAKVSGIASYEEAYFEAFQYNADATYVLVIVPDNIQIYLEGSLVSTVTTTGITASMIPLIDSTTIESNFRISSSAFVPKDLIRSSNADNIIASVSTTEITLTTPVTDGLILPTQFTTAGTLPTTDPQILLNQNYY